MTDVKNDGKVDWQQIDTVLLDMDGTLLDKHFDDYFWESHVPEVFAKQNGMSILEAEETLLAKYKAEEGTLAWTDINFWSAKLGLDIAALKRSLRHLIKVHPYVVDFLDCCRHMGKQIYLVTNAHPTTLDIKMAETGLASKFDGIICSDELGVAKEEQLFWIKLMEKLKINKKKCLLAEDTEKILHTAQEFGIKNLIYISKSSSTKPVQHSRDFPSIIFFKEIIPAEPGKTEP